MTHRTLPLAAILVLLLTANQAVAGSQQQALLEHYLQQAGKPFSAARGQALFEATHSGGKPDTPSCTTCHGPDPAKRGKTRAGKVIMPMAVSQTPDRFSDQAKVEKWFRRNCRSVLGRECTALEKGDFITFMLSK